MQKADELRQAIYRLLEMHKRPLSCSDVHQELARRPWFKGLTYETVSGALVEMSFEGLIKLDYEPVVMLNPNHA